MDLTSGIVWAILIFEAAALGFIGFWFSLRTLRWFAFVNALLLAVVVARFGLTHPEYKTVNLVNSFLSGADRVTIALLHPFWPGKVPAPGVPGRWIIAFGLLLGYRQLERWTLHWQAPELDMSSIGRDRSATTRATARTAALTGAHRHGICGRTAGQHHAQLAAELRFRLPTMEVRAPAILPGGTRANALASIAEASGVSGAGMFSAVVRLAGIFWPRPLLARVRCWVESPEGRQITVLLEDVRTGLPIATNTVAGNTVPEAASMVAGYIARQIFGMDRTVPEWCYGLADGRDLGAMQLARMKRVCVECPEDVAESRREQIGILSRSMAVRTAGFVRYELAQLLALEFQHLESLRLHAVNRELHGRFYRGRYRFAMSLEMIANQEHYLPDGEAARLKLEETLEIISRCGITEDTLYVSVECPVGNGDGKSSSVKASCMRVSEDLALKLLKIAVKDLRELRTQLSWWHVWWDALWHRNERSVWLPHLRHGYRQQFHDGVCVAELLLAIRCRLRESGDPGRFERMRARLHLWWSIRITSLIAGDPARIKRALADPRGDEPLCHWWIDTALNACAGSIPRARDRVRWLALQRRTASWQAAYNTACLYAALTDKARTNNAPKEVLEDLEDRVIVSLRRAVGNPHAELERPSGWIHSDPDFRAMRDDPQTFPSFKSFLEDLSKRDYPVFHANGKCSVPHANPANPPAAVESLVLSSAPVSP